MKDVVSLEHQQSSHKLAATLAVHRRSEDLINIGAYVKGSNRNIDHAIDMIDRINGFLQQGIEEKVNFDQSKVELCTLCPPAER
jgi:flagellum-specific ATP synthase